MTRRVEAGHSAGPGAGVRLREHRAPGIPRPGLTSALAGVVVLLGLLAAPSPGACQGWPSDPWLEEPIDEATFDTFLQFFRYDHDLSLDVRVRGEEESEGVIVQRLSFVSTPDERVPALFYRPAGADWTSRPSLLQLHGGSGEGKGASHYVQVARRLVRGGFNVLAIDLDHFGERDDGLLTTYTEEDKHEHLYNRPSVYLQWVVQTVKDAGRARDLLVREKGLEPDRIGLFGFSRGAQVGIVVAGVDDRFRASAFLLAGHFDAGETEHLAAACPANYVGRISPRPVYFINGIYDQDYDRERSVEPIHRLAREPKTVDWVETGHALPPPEALEELIVWLRRHLP